MSQKEKAKQICENMWQHIGGRYESKEKYNKEYDLAKQCALVAVDVILE